MSPEVEHAIDLLREWRAEAEAATPDQYASVLGGGEWLVGHLLDTLDREAVADVAS